VEEGDKEIQVVLVRMRDGVSGEQIRLGKEKKRKKNCFNSLIEFAPQVKSQLKRAEVCQTDRSRHA
jgi:hypothetical protein